VPDVYSGKWFGVLNVVSAGKMAVRFFFSSKRLDQQRSFLS
jgi:hypothetical protein